LSSLGKVTSIDITIPPPRQARAGEATPEAAARGRRLLARARDAVGGQERIRAVKEYTMAADLTLSIPQGEFSMQTETTVNLGGRMLARMTTPMGEVSQGYDGQAAWMRTPQGVREIPASQRGEVESSFFRDTLRLLRDFEAAGVSVQALGEEELEGRKTEAVLVHNQAGNYQVKLYLDPATGLPAGKSYTAALMGAPGEMREVYADWRESGGLKFPYKTTLYRDGRKIGESVVHEVKVNPGLPDSAYRKPE
ncbi:MAG: hypothetical protein ACP5U2_16540, partial [Bryobacteraceae bacterium]